MEFLDPEEKRAKTLKLFFSYTLAIVAVVSTTIVLSFVLQGVDLLSRQADTKNGLLFVDSKPVSAEVLINNQSNRSTAARYVLPENTYQLELRAEGYRGWSKTINVVGGKVRYHVYPKLVPNQISTINKSTYKNEPFIYTQSPDRRWLIVSPTNEQLVLHRYDLNDPESGPSQIAIPETVVSLEDFKTSKFELIEWSNDSEHILYQKQLPDGTKQYIIIDIQNPDESINLTTQLQLDQRYSLTLKDQKFDKYYVLDSKTNILRAANLKDGIEPKILAENVVDYKYYGDNIIFYATTSGAEEGELSLRVLRGSETFLLDNLPKSDNISLDVAVYENEWYYIAASQAGENALLFINPLDRIPNISDGGVIKPQIQLIVDNPKSVSFSDNTRFVAAQSADSLAVYDAEISKKYRYKSPVELSPMKARWMDGHRFSLVSGGTASFYEFDGLNKQDLVAALDGYRPFYDRDYEYLYTINKNDAGDFLLQQSSLIVEN